MSKDMKPYLIDPFVRFIYVHMKEHKENRNIIKLDQESGSCLVYTNKWEERVDCEAIPSLVMKYFIEFNNWLKKEYDSITDSTPANHVGDIINGVTLVEILRKKDPVYMVNLYNFVAVMLEDIGREFFPEKYPLPEL